MTALARPEWALVLGGADCVWADVAAWEAHYGQPWDGVIIAANDIGAHWPRELHHWVSLHPEKFPRWAALRVEHGFLPGYVTWTSTKTQKRGTADRALEEKAPGGSSGLLGVQVARDLGCTKIILCGVPMTPTAHFAETTERFANRWHQARGHWGMWLRHKEKFANEVRSMSGRTRELFGAPSVEWLVT